MKLKALKREGSEKNSSPALTKKGQAFPPEDIKARRTRRTIIRPDKLLRISVMEGGACQAEKKFDLSLEKLELTTFPANDPKRGGHSKSRSFKRESTWEGRFASLLASITTLREHDDHEIVIVMR